MKTDKLIFSGILVGAFLVLNVSGALAQKSSDGAVRRMRTRLSMAMISQFYAAQSCCHSTRAASR